MSRTVVAAAIVWAMAVAALEHPAAQGKAGAAFKNVTTSTLKELSVDDFLASMGVISADLGMDCADCHPNAGTDTADFAADNARKRTTRRMVEMVAAINGAHFGSQQRVTCWTCHHGRMTPTTTIALDAWYAPPIFENDDLVRTDPDLPPADRILDKYLQALGGADTVAAVTSIAATGTAAGYGRLGGTARFQLFAKSPNQRTTLITFPDHPERGESLWTFDGRAGWVKTPRGLVAEYEILGGELDGARLEAQLAFPAQIRQALTNWRGPSRQSVGDREYLALQGSGARGLLATLYFDRESGLLTRLVRHSPSPIGRMPTQIDYADYRSVSGVKFPFELRVSWLDGRYTARIDEIRTNIAIDAARFGRPGRQ